MNSTQAATPFVFQSGELLLAASEAALPSMDVLREAGIVFDDAHTIGEWEGKTCLTLVIPDGDAPAGTRRCGLRASFSELGEPLFVLAGRAAQVLEWERSHQFCGRCGERTQFKSGEFALRCKPCKASYYPRIMPAIMVLVHGNGKLLLARGARHAPGHFTAVAGFVEAGESLEETARREVREEVGVEIDDLKYFGSQSWPFPGSLMVAFTAAHAGGDPTPDGVEITEARWFDPAELPGLPMPISIANRLITGTSRKLLAGEPL